MSGPGADPMSAQPLRPGQQQNFRLGILRRQNEGTCTTCLKVTLLALNILFLLAGVAVVGVGVWLSIDDVARNALPVITTTDMMSLRAPVYMLTAGGVLLALLSFFGCLAIMVGNPVILLIYAVGLVVVIVVQSVACGLAFTFKDKATKFDPSSTLQVMKDTLTRQYGVDTSSNAGNQEITEAWDIVQSQLQCCGVQGNTSSPYSWSFYRTSTEWLLEQNMQAKRRFVPDSCCAEGDLQLCVGLKDFNGPPIFFNNFLPQYAQVNPYLYTTGCYDKLSPYLTRCSAIAAWVSAGAASLSVLGLLVTMLLLLLLCRMVRKSRH